MTQYGIVPPPDPEKHPASWRVEDGVLIGEQATPGYGGYLVSEETFGDFELDLELRPDWPADTGVMIRRLRDSWEGFQILVDHRPSGGIGGFFGNGLASFSAVPFAIDAALDESGKPIGLKADDPATSVEPVTPDKIARLAYAARVEDFWASFMKPAEHDLAAADWLYQQKLAARDALFLSFVPAEDVLPETRRNAASFFARWGGCVRLERTLPSSTGAPLYQVWRYRTDIECAVPDFGAGPAPPSP